MDLAIRNTRLLTMADGKPNPVPNGAVGVDDGELVSVGPDGDFDGDPEATVDGSDHVTIPGLVDAHVHTVHTLLRGGAQDVPEIEWMNRALGPLARQMDDEDRIAGARLGVLEGLLSGVTTFGEYATDVADLVEGVYGEWGVRVAATETINEVSDEREDVGPDEPYPFDRERGEAALARAQDLVESYADDPLVEPMYGPQALDMVSLDLLHETFERAASHGATVHVHVAQGERERRQIRARYGEDASTVSVFDGEDLLDERLLAVHCHGATDGERERLATAGARYVGCPSSIAAIDGVVPPVEQFREAGAAVGLGTDQAPGPGGHDFLGEARTAAMLAKTDRGDPTALPAWHALRLATLGGARALGIDDTVGSLEVGKRADVAMVPVDDPGLAPVVDDPLATVVPNLVYGGARADAVLVDGEFVLRDGELVPGDGEAVVATARRRAEDTFGRGADDWRAAESELVDRVDEGWL
jgi:5-methylthioadenosine/S-adenosylhomocysteine deaminase